MHSFLIDDQAIDERAVLQKCVPITTVAGEPRRLYREHGTGALRANRSEQMFEARPRRATARTSEIIVDDDHVRPTKRLSACLQRILAPTTFGIIGELVLSGLPHINISGARQVISSDLVHRWPFEFEIESARLRCIRR